MSALPLGRPRFTVGTKSHSLDHLRRQEGVKGHGGTAGKFVEITTEN